MSETEGFSLDQVLDQERELLATEAAANNECLVPETSNELYDCCGSILIESECEVFGILNAVILGSLVISIFVLHFKSTWFHN